ncbi:hypothetical protein [Hydrogenophaga borbori]|nr:hypothetical protein [Hydrogenophaga borbori]
MTSPSKSPEVVPSVSSPWRWPWLPSWSSGSFGAPSRAVGVRAAG